MRLKIEGAVATHVGRVRSNNEDNYNLFGNYRHDTEIKQKTENKTVLPEQMAAAVFDGMGGEEAGEVASLMAAKAFMPCEAEDIKNGAVRQMRAVNDEICGEMKRRGGVRMGTTAVALYLDKGRAVCCNVGDSRCYLMRDGALRQLSTDHSEAARMIEMGVLAPEAARQSKSWHKLTQHLGIFPEEFVIEPYVSGIVELCPGDIFMLCSDGLTDMVMDDEIARMLGEGQSAEEMAGELTGAALAAGGRDNVTVMVLKVKEDETYREEKAKGSLLTPILGGTSILLLLFSIGVTAFFLNNKEAAEKWEKVCCFDPVPMGEGAAFVKGTLLNGAYWMADDGAEGFSGTEIGISDTRTIVDNKALFAGDEGELTEKGMTYLDGILELYKTYLKDGGVLFSDGELTEAEEESDSSSYEAGGENPESHTDKVKAYCFGKYPELSDYVEIRAYFGGKE